MVGAGGGGRGWHTLLFNIHVSVNIDIRNTIKKTVFIADFRFLNEVDFVKCNSHPQYSQY